MEKKILGKKRRFLLFTLLHILGGIIAVGLGVIIINAWVGIANVSRNYSYSYMLEPWDLREDYEDTSLFNDIFSNGIEDITRMAVIRSQMETQYQYDGKKIIDIAAFANRKNYGTENETAGQVQYYLEDLIKWSNYGFGWIEELVSSKNPDLYFRTPESGETLKETEIELQQELPAEDEITEEAADTEEDVAQQPNEQETGIETEENPVNGTAGKESAVEVNAGITEEGEEEEEEYLEGRDILVERYRTVDGKNLRDFATNWDEYNELTDMLEQVSSELADNYREYKNWGELYDGNNTNLKYCYEMFVDGKKEYISNLEIQLESVEDYTEYFQQNFGKYLYYNPDNLDFVTNTNMYSGRIQNYLRNYEYAYPENTRIWIGVDTDYPVTDAFREGYIKYNDFMPYYWIITIVLIILSIIYITLLIVLIVFEGRDREYALKTIDRIPMEVMSIFAGIGAAILVFGISLVIYQYEAGFLSGGGYNLEWIPVESGILGVFISLYFWIFCMTTVRRLKAHAFWKTTLIGHIFIWIKSKIVKIFRYLKELFIKLYNNADLVVRIGMPFIILMALNWLLLLIGFIGIIICIVIDTAACIFLMKEAKCRQEIVGGIEKIRDGNLAYQIDTQGMLGDNLILANSVNSIGEGIRIAVEKSMKDERLKADLITNVSHDIKTPLTSIINYVDLLKRENIEDEKLSGYIAVLDTKSQRLKQLTEDLVEASKISSGNISYQMEKINFVELIYQTLGEFSEKFEEKQLSIIAKLPEHPIHIEADSRRIWRIIENIYNNIYKYALPGTRVYLDMRIVEEMVPACVELSVKNISAQPLNINADELTERFIRGDVSRSTEGSGLGLSIAKNLAQAQKGEFTIYLDGDLFKIILTFPILE